MTISIRPVRPDDLPFLEQMFVVAGNWNADQPPHPLSELLQIEQLRGYIENWGRAGDTGFIAEDEGVPVGAAWRRFYPGDKPGYGFLSEDIPEVSIGVHGDWRGQGIGGSLLSALEDDARRAGLPALSLSVEVANPALRLYLRQGFRMIRTTGEDHVLRLDLG